MKINIIAAVGKNLELGKGNDLVWRIKEDLNYFKELTTNKIIVMGYNTYLSIGRLLPNRKNIIISKENRNIEGAIVLNSIKDVLNLDEEEIFIIGGASIYKQFIPYADNLYLTEINSEDDKADVFFPKFDKEHYEKKLVKASTENNLNYNFVCYESKMTNMCKVRRKETQE